MSEQVNNATVGAAAAGAQIQTPTHQLPNSGTISGSYVGPSAGPSSSAPTPSHATCAAAGTLPPRPPPPRRDGAPVAMPSSGPPHPVIMCIGSCLSSLVVYLIFVILYIHA